MIELREFLGNVGNDLWHSLPAAIILLVAQVVDIAVAWVVAREPHNGPWWDSRLTRAFTVWMLVTLCGAVDGVLPTIAFNVMVLGNSWEVEITLMAAICWWFVIQEWLSVIESAVGIGVRVPRFLAVGLNRVQGLLDAIGERPGEDRGAQHPNRNE